jgi:hypothetical protein
MIDIFALSIAHGLLVLAALRLIGRDELDREGEARPRFGTRIKPPMFDDDRSGDGGEAQP